MIETDPHNALRDLGRFMRDMYVWCDQNGDYTTGMVSVSRDTIKRMRRVLDAVLEADVHGGKVCVSDWHGDVYTMLTDTSARRKGER